MRICEVEGCDRAHAGRGWCALHLNRWYRNDTTDDLGRTIDPIVSPSDHPFRDGLIAEGARWSGC
jgi:hypothetical protein